MDTWIKKEFKECWLKLPKLICLCIWIKCNLRIFQDKAQPAWKIVTKAQDLMGEILNVKVVPKNKGNLIGNEINWLQNFNFFADTNLAKKHLENWEIRFDKSQFENWLKERKIFKLFFYGASKGNPMMAGGGGVIIFLEGKIET